MPHPTAVGSQAVQGEGKPWQRPPAYRQGENSISLQFPRGQCLCVHKWFNVCKGLTIVMPHKQAARDR
jgi:hypothetical protein